MEKYAKLLKGLEVCAGPECCKDGCPYYGETTAGMTCRARLLRDAEIAINNEQALHESAEEALAHRYEDIERLQADADNREAAYKTIRAERDKLNQELTAVIQHRDELAADVHHVRETREDLIKANEKVRADNEELRKECDMLATRCTVLQNEINALVLKMGGKHDGKTDRPSVDDDALENLACEAERYRTEAAYARGKADALKWFICEWFREGGFQS